MELVSNLFIRYGQYVLLISFDAVEVMVEVQNEGGRKEGFEPIWGITLPTTS